MKHSNTSRKSIKDSIELISTIKGRRLTKEEIRAITFLGETMGQGDNKNDNRKTAKNIVNPPSNVNYLKDSLKY